jgi:N-methylhydantoinase A/oxoprolinase/acetone carboxylase beta subunit
MLEADRVHRFKPGSGLPIAAPTVDLIEIGAGGGSIARLDSLGLLKVGPHSAASNPGPACYGLGGTEPTVTDANVLLGYLDPDYFLGGRMALRPELAREAVAARVAGPLGLTPAEAARGIHAVVNENMARAARTHLIERNRDPRGVAIVAFGGAGPAHAAAVARILGSTRVIVPPGAGVASAIGALTAPLALPFVRSYMTPLGRADWRLVRRLYAEMRAEARRAFAGVVTDAEIRDQLAADIRFTGQYHEIRVDLPPDADGPHAAGAIEAAFRAAYAEVYGRAPSGLTPEVLNWHLTAEVPRTAFALTEEPRRAGTPEAARKGEREVYFSGPEAGPRRCPVYDRYRLEPGVEIAGPCIIEEREATVVVPPDGRVAVDGYRNLIIALAAERWEA